MTKTQRIFGITFLSFCGFLFVIGTIDALSDDKAPHTSDLNTAVPLGNQSCTHWTKIVNKQGLQVNAEPLRAVPDCPEPDAVEVSDEASKARYEPPTIPAGPAAPYMREAENYLGGCFGTDAEIQICKNEQTRFEQEYVNALAGDYLAQSNVSFEFLRPQYGAVRKNTVQSCSWRLVIMMSGSKYLNDLDTEKTRNACQEAGQAAEAAATSRATEIQRIILSRKVHKVAVPAIDFDPRREQDEE